MFHFTALLGAVVGIGLLVATETSPVPGWDLGTSPVDGFNDWVAFGADQATNISKRLTKEFGTVRGKLIAVKHHNVEHTTLRWAFEHTDASLESMPRWLLPIKTHVMGRTYLSRQKYFPQLSRALMKLEASKSLGVAVYRNAIALMTEMALGASSPLFPWCRLLLAHPRAVAKTMPPLLWPRSLLDEVEPKTLRDDVKRRVIDMESWLKRADVQNLLKALETFVRSETQGESVFNMTSLKNFVLAVAVVEVNSFVTHTEGLTTVPLSGYFESLSRVDFSVAAKFVQLGGDQLPMIRRTSHSFVENEFWQLTPHARSVQVPGQEGSTSAEPVVLEEMHPVAPEAYWLTFGRSLIGGAWEHMDCQLIVFSKTLPKERVAVRGELADVFETVLHHYSCLTFDEEPIHGLLGSLIATLPRDTPTSVITCARAAFESHVPVNDAKLADAYRATLRCLKAAPWKQSDAYSSLLARHYSELRKSIEAYKLEQFRAMGNAPNEGLPGMPETQSALLDKWKQRAEQGAPTAEEMIGVLQLRNNRKRIISRLLSKLKSLEDAVDSESDEL